jgi:nitroreductase
MEIRCGGLTMNIYETIEKRYSCRAYIDKLIEADKLGRILEAARLAPSAKNLQDWRFVIVTEPEKRARLAEAACDQKFLAKAGAIVVGCSNNTDTMHCGQAIGPIDVSIAMEHIALAAVEEGLATCWIGAFYTDKVRSIIGVPENIQIIELMSVGYPADSPRPGNRAEMDKIVCYEQWSF